MSRRGPVPDFPRDRPRVPDVIELVQDVYLSDEGSVGCCLHVLVDDDNYSEAAWTLEYARERGHELCARAAEMMTRMSPSQVRRVCDYNYYRRQSMRDWPHPRPQYRRTETGAIEHTGRILEQE